MRPIDVYFLVGLTVAIAMVLTLTVLGGRMTSERRKQVERGMALVFYPMAVVLWLWRAVGFYREGDLLSTAAMAVVATLFIWLGVRAVRTSRLVPRPGPTP